jgi:hypothetical protein
MIGFEEFRQELRFDTLAGRVGANVGFSKRSLVRKSLYRFY